MTDDTLLVADYKSLEVAILADFGLRLFKDDQLAKLVMPGAPDIHSNNVRLVYGDYLGRMVPAGQPYAGKRVSAIPVDEVKEHPTGGELRKTIKNVFYGWCYGKRGYGFATLEDESGQPIGEERANELVAGLMHAVPTLAKWEKWVEGYVDANHGIYSLGGRWCDLSPEMESGEEWLRRRAYRRAYNFPCQATGADIIGDAMVRVQGCPILRRLGYRLLLNVHDELILRGPLDDVEMAGALLRDHMCAATANGIQLLVPLQVSVGHGQNYWECK